VYDTLGRSSDNGHWISSGVGKTGRGATHGLVVDDTIATATIEDEYLDATGLGTELRKA